MSVWSDGITSAAAVLGVGLAAWKWVFQEVLRRKLEIPSIDGEIEIENVGSNDDVVGIFVNSIWNNRGTVPIYLDPGETKFSVHEIDMSNAPNAIGQFETSDKSHASAIRDIVGSNPEPKRLLLEFHPIKDQNWFMLEPKTKSRIQVSLLLQKDRVYELRCYIVTVERADQNWSRKRLFSTVSRTIGAPE